MAASSTSTTPTSDRVMTIWFNKLNESRRASVEVRGDEISLGRDPQCDVQLRSPLVSRRHAVLRRIEDGTLELQNVGVNSCLVGETEILGGQRVTFSADTKVRIWPFTISFESERRATFTRSARASAWSGATVNVRS